MLLLAAALEGSAESADALLFIDFKMSSTVLEAPDLLPFEKASSLEPPDFLIKA